MEMNEIGICEIETRDTEAEAEALKAADAKLDDILKNR